MKVKNVIKGLLREYNLEEINIITPSKVAFSGRYEQWKTTSLDMVWFKKKIDESEVVNRMIFHDTKAFIFIPELDSYYPPKE